MNPNLSPRRRALSLLLALSLILGLLPGASPAAAADAASAEAAPAGHWAAGYLNQLIEWGFIRADQAENPDQALTRADFMSIVNRAYGYHDVGPTPFEDVSEYDWFYDDVGIAYTARYINGTSPTTASPNDTLDRETAATILGRNMMLQESAGEILDFSDARDISNWARGTIKSSMEHYLVSGYDDGTFRPQQAMTWGEIAAMLTRTVGTPLQDEGEYSLGGVFGNVTVTAPGVTLRDTVISGDLYITGGVGLGGIKLENVTVLGRIIASGTGTSEGGASILMRNVTADELLVDNLQDKEVSIQADGITEIGKTTVRSSAYIEDNTPDGLGLHMISFEGDFYGEDEEVPEGWAPPRLTLAGRIEEVVNRTPNSTVEAAKGTVAKLTVDEEAEGSNVVIDRGAVIKDLVLDTGVNVTGEGDITKLEVNAPGSIVTMLPDEIVIRPGITAVIDGQVMDSTAAEESSMEPMILSGYPQATDIAPNSITALFATNKKGTIYWAVSAITDGSVGEDDLIKPPAYGGISVQRGSLTSPRGGEEVTAAVAGLEPDGSYYLSAVLVDDRGQRSPVKVISFTTPDNTVPAFNQGYPYMSMTSRTNSQVVVMANKACVMYYALYPQGAAAPTASDLKTASVAGSLGYGVRTLEKNTEDVFQVNDRTLEEEETYVIYFWLTDANGANSSAVTSLTFTTADETLPYFLQGYPAVTNVTANSVGLTFRINENGTVFWAVVEEGARYPLPEPGQTGTAPLDGDYAKLQVASGLNALAFGRVTATGNADGTINVTGLEPEKAYDLYYLAQDTAGNYSIRVEHMTINTLDNTGPKVQQTFSKYSGTDNTMNPMSDTAIILEFSENVCSSGSVGKDFLALYQETLSSSDPVQAMTNFVTALRESITLYQQGIGTGRPQAVNAKISTNDDSEDWVIDYTKAQVASKDGKLLLTFPDEALNLSSGSTYYFEITNLTDNSTARNPIVPSTVDYNQASIAQGHNVPRFTVVFAQVSMASLDLGTNTLPYTREDKVANSKPNGSSTAAPDSTDDDLAEVDASFRIEPLSTSTVEDNMGYDILIWSDTTMEFDLFYRVVNRQGDALITSENIGTTDYALPNMSAKTIDSHGWVLLGGSGQLLAAAGEDLGGKSVNRQFNSCLTAASFPPLNKLDDSGNIYYEFAISVTKIGTSNERRTWSGDVNFYVNVAASTGNNLLSLANGLSEANWNRFTTNGLGSGGGASIGTATDGTDRLHLFHTFTDTQVPRFSGTAPQFTPGDTFVDMRVNLDRACTVYYVIAPVASDKPLASVSTTVEYEDNLILDGDILTQLGAFIESGGTPDPNKEPDGTGTYTETEWVKAPQKLDVVQPKYTETEIKKGSFSYSGGQGYQTETVKDLLPLTDYYVYFVLRGASQEMSQVYLYTFKTVNISKPIIQLNRNVSGTVSVSTHVNSVLDYNIVTTTQWNQIMKDQLPSSWCDSFVDADGNSLSVPDDFKDMTILEAMMTTYTVAAAADALPDGASRADYYIPNDSTTVNYSVFDVYAKQSVKDNVAELIRAGSSTAGSIAGGQIEPRANYTPSIMVDERSEMKLGTSYVFLTVAHHESGTIDSFRAVDNVALPDTEPPAPISITTYITGYSTNDAGMMTYTGNVTITFDKNLYWMPSTSSSSTAAKPVYNNGTSAGADDDWVGILQYLGSNFTLACTNRGNNPTSTFNIIFEGVLVNGSIVIFDNGVISNSSGSATTEKLTLIFEQQAGGNNDSGLPIQSVGFTAKWGGRDVPANLVPITQSGSTRGR